MANRHPYFTSRGPMVQVINHLRGSFPSKVDATTLQKLGYAPKNESYVINVLRFMRLISEEGAKMEKAADCFNIHDDDEFAVAFEQLVKDAYDDLFQLHGEGTWELEKSALISFFRSSDGTTALVGDKQSQTFQLLAAFAGHGDVPEPKKRPSSSPKPGRKKAAKKKAGSKTPDKVSEKQLNKPVIRESRKPDIGLTVRVEVNLPASGEQAVYDRIFKSIRKNLIDDQFT